MMFIMDMIDGNWACISHEAQILPLIMLSSLWFVCLKVRSRCLLLAFQFCICLNRLLCGVFVIAGSVNRFLRLLALNCNRRIISDLRADGFYVIRKMECANFDCEVPLWISRYLDLIHHFIRFVFVLRVILEGSISCLSSMVPLNECYQKMAVNLSRKTEWSTIV